MRIVALVLSLAAGVLLSQVPEFGQQYRQRLGGAIDELNRIIANFDADSAKSGYTRDSALALMARNEEQLVRDQALRMAETIVRLDRLTAQQRAFAEQGSFGRLGVLAADYDQQLMDSAIRDFEPAVPTTVEGFMFGLGGFVVVYFLLRGLGWLFRRRPRHLAEAR